ncbi:exodeoxyribonuclease VII small subunit [Aneurinibacillus terranovensis]|uniref:exodeoxyribonuclease VII small subunit n=1 Tax=Aneurinibacillus terranovensis TaxID=278991 RepID=UPI0003F69E4E|nr:exodeoxyribonuclease VII small subunit [Aneurinibacillus terranovensis]
MGKSEVQDLPFEEALKKLEHIVEQLEAGEVPLEQAISLFQEGMELSRICSQTLTNVEQKIEALLEKDGELTPAAFHLEGED